MFLPANVKEKHSANLPTLIYNTTYFVSRLRELHMCEMMMPLFNVDISFEISKWAFRSRRDLKMYIYIDLAWVS